MTTMRHSTIIVNLWHRPRGLSPAAPAKDSRGDSDRMASIEWFRTNVFSPFPTNSRDFGARRRVGRIVPTPSQWFGAFLLIFLMNSMAEAQNAPPRFEKPPRITISEENRAELAAGAETLKKAIDAIPGTISPEVAADLTVFHKAVTFALELGEFYVPGDVDSARRLLATGQARAAALARGEKPWTSAKGPVAIGFMSRIDNSVQPAVVVIPDALKFDRTQRAKLVVVLHGRDERLSEVRFLASRSEPKILPNPAADAITLHIYGRGNNAYRWAGETDVFEAIEAVKRRYPIDDRKIALQGFSMGGAGAWHLGLHHPSLWAAVEAGAGFTETKNYAKLQDDQLTPTTVKLLNIYDAQSYALNVLNTPIAGYGGEDDPQLQASTNILDALKGLGLNCKTERLVSRGEGFDFLRVVGAKTGHKVDEPSRLLLDDFQKAHLAQGTKTDPKRLRFVTYTAKYNRAAWLTVERLVEHYRRAEVDAEVIGAKLVIRKAENVAMLGIDRHVAETVEIEGEAFPLEGAVKGLLPNVYYRRTEQGDGKWRVLEYDESRAFELGASPSKSRNLQGPIDEAFSGPFLCVKGTGQPWSPALGKWADARLKAFQTLWKESLRGELPVKNDNQVTPEDIESRHLILFGDPGSNLWIAKLADQLPTLSWSRAEFKLGGERYAAADHVPCLVAPNPLNVQKYVVVNSGHTFKADAFAGTNALLYPRLGDYGVFQTDGRNETLRASGLFDEGWSFREAR